MLGLRASRAIRSPAFRRTFTNSTRRLEGETKLTGAADNAFNREREAVKHHAEQTSDLWWKLSVYVVIPALMISGVNAYRLWDEHWTHVAHEGPIENRVQYPYMNIRTKAFPWYDPDKTLFWNSDVNYVKRDE